MILNEMKLKLIEVEQHDLLLIINKSKVRIEKLERQRQNIIMGE